MTERMSPQERRSAARPLEDLPWHRLVPGARWFTSDLHVHTLDDRPGGRISCTTTGPADHATWERYAVELLQTAVARGVEVIGLTPHALYSAGDESLCCVSKIVDAWMSASADDGTPFREKIYAIFPGFEASMADGARGVHLQFLFDPEIGREGLVRAYHAVMGGVDPWDGNQLRNASRSADEAFDGLIRLEEQARGAWKWICLAPHAFNSGQGLFGQLKSQMLQVFPHQYIAALELGDEQTSAEAHEGRDWLAPGMRRYHHALYHASDAYILNPDPTSTELNELGSRTALLKLATPTIESLRQAFLAADSRLRTTLRRDDSGNLVADAAPDPLARDRPWLRELSVTGGTSFFGGQTAAGPRTVTFRLNPDLTCVIGGRMTGKSTLLDGIRVHGAFPLPTELQVRQEVEGRARSRFLSGGPAIETDVCGPVAETEALRLRWPAVFFTQRELQRAAVEQTGLRQLLFHLSSEPASLEAQWTQVSGLNSTLRGLLPGIARTRGELAEVEQSLASAERAQEAMERWERVGAPRLTEAQADVGRLRTLTDALSEIRRLGEELSGALGAVAVPEMRGDSVREVVTDAELAAVQRGIAEAVRSTDEATTTLAQASDAVTRLSELADQRAAALRTEIQEALATEGGSPDELNQFAALAERAAALEETRLRAEGLREAFRNLEGRFDAAVEERTRIQTDHRRAMAGTIDRVLERFQGSITVMTVENGVTDELEEWITNLRERGITRWWNERGGGDGLSPAQLLQSLESGALHELGMSEAVAATFRDATTEDRRRQLQAIDTPDRYVLSLRVADDQYRPMPELSGGQQVSILLSLLLESDDIRPLLIDQPEEELDKSYLFETVLPALRRLKGKRQIVFVTHDANIVVNGDADQVIFLRATADRGSIAAEGAIEDADVRDAILVTLDGGEEAFELRARKYGF